MVQVAVLDDVVDLCDWILAGWGCLVVLVGAGEFEVRRGGVGTRIILVHRGRRASPVVLQLPSPPLTCLPQEAR